MLLMKKLWKHISEIQLEISHFTKGMYPSFVTAKSPEPIRNEIPVFMFHSIDPKTFEEQLEFLSLNRYHTITIDEFYDFLMGRKHLPDRSILLTIDDGRGSVWTYGYPLLKKYSFRATVFLISGYTREAKTHYPNLEDYWSGRVPLGQLVDRDKSDDPLLSWYEVLKMHESGLIDFQSHSLYHHKIFTKPQIVDFFNPREDQPLYDLVLPYSYEDNFCYGLRGKLFGMPIYSNNSLMSGEPRYFDDEGLRLDCISYVAENGGKGFFNRPRWKEEMLERVERYKNKYGLQDRMATPEERDQEILENLKKSKRIIEERLSRKVVRHFCFPNGIGSNLAVEFSKVSGYVTNFWSYIHGRRANVPGDDPFYCVRLKNDFIFRLPGKGRKSLLEIMRFKLMRRLSGELVY